MAASALPQQEPSERNRAAAQFFRRYIETYFTDPKNSADGSVTLSMHTVARLGERHQEEGGENAYVIDTYLFDERGALSIQVEDRRQYVTHVLRVVVYGDDLTVLLRRRGGRATEFRGCTPDSVSREAARRSITLELRKGLWGQ